MEQPCVSSPRIKATTPDTFLRAPLLYRDRTHRKHRPRFAFFARSFTTRHENEVGGNRVTAKQRRAVALLNRRPRGVRTTARENVTYTRERENRRWDRTGSGGTRDTCARDTTTYRKNLIKRSARKAVTSDLPPFVLDSRSFFEETRAVIRDSRTSRMLFSRRRGIYTAVNHAAVYSSDPTKSSG